MPNIFETITATSKAPDNSGANLVSEPSVTLYKPDLEAQRETLLNNAFGSKVFTGSEKDYNELAEYGAQPNLYQEQSDLEKIRAKNQSAWTQAGNALGQTIGTVIGDTVGGIGMLVDLATFGLMDDQAYSNVITRAGDAISDYVRNDLFPIYRENPDKAFDMNDFSGWFFSQVPSIASSLSLMIPGTAFAKGVTAIGKGVASLGNTGKMARVMNWAKKASKLDNVYKAAKYKTIAQDGLTAIGMRLGENYQEARGVAEQINQEALDLFAGMNPDQMQKWMQENPDIAKEANGDVNEMAKLIAEKAANRDFAYNSGNVFFDFLQLRAVNKAFGQINRAITPRLRYAQNQALDRIASTGVESASQTLGQAAKGTITGLAGKFNRMINSSENLLLSELSEGVEEAVNFVGQEEGTAYGRYLMGQDGDFKDQFFDMNRIQNYLKDPQLYNAALWGVIGGVVFGGAMSAINNRKGGIIDEKMRLSEINAREQLFSKYATDMDAITRGENPYEVERDADGNPIRYLDDGTISQDQTVGTTRFAKISPEEQEVLAEEAKTRFGTTLAMNAIRTGNFELLKDYITDERMKKKLIDSGLADEATYDQDTQQLTQILDNTLKKFVDYSTSMRSANIDDALLDIAITENINNGTEADLLDKRVQRLNNLQVEIERTTPQLTEILDPLARNRVDIAMLESYRRDAYESYNTLKQSKNPLDKIKANYFLDFVRVIENKIDEKSKALSPAENLLTKDWRSKTDQILGLPANETIKDEIEEFLKSPENEVLFKEAISDFQIKKLMNDVRNINSEYADNISNMLLDEIRRDELRARIVTTNEEIQKKAENDRAQLEAMRKAKVDDARNYLKYYVKDSVNSIEELDALQKAMNGEAQTGNEEANARIELLMLDKDVETSKKELDKYITQKRNLLLAKQTSERQVEEQTSERKVEERKVEERQSTNPKLEAIRAKIERIATPENLLKRKEAYKKKAIIPYNGKIYNAEALVEELGLDKEATYRFFGYDVIEDDYRDGVTPIVEAIDNGYIPHHTLKGTSRSESDTVGIGEGKTISNDEYHNIRKEATKAKQQQRTDNNGDSSTGELSSEAAVSNSEVQEPTSVKPSPTPKTEPERKLEETLAKALSDKVDMSIVTNANISKFDFTVNHPFASLDFNGKPTKVDKISVTVSKFGNVSIDGMNTKNEMIADVTIDELNLAIAEGAITATPKEEPLESSIEDTEDTEETPLESSIQDLDLESARKRIEEIKLIIDLYNQIAGNKFGDKTFTSINDMMVYLQKINPRAVDLYNDIKLLSNQLQTDGKIITIDETLKSPNEIAVEAKKTLTDAVAEKKQENKSHSYFFNLVNLDNEKVYARINELHQGNTVSVELVDDVLQVKSKGVVIGEFPRITYNNGNVEAKNQGWTYTIKDEGVPFVEAIKDIIASNSESSKEFLSTLNNLRRLYKVRNNPDVESTYGHLLNTLQENENWKNLNTMFGIVDGDIQDKIRHLGNIIFFDYNVGLGVPNFNDIVIDSLTTWANKIKQSYTDINDLRSSIAKTKSKKKRLTIDNTSSGSLIFKKDKIGRPVYSKLADVVTVESTDGYRLVRGDDRGVIDVKTGQHLDSSSIRRGVVGVTIRDSEGRLLAVPTRENSMSNEYGGETAYTKKFNEGLDNVFHTLFRATLDKNKELHSRLLDELATYIGDGKALYGYKVSGRALMPKANRPDAPIIYFNIDDDIPSVKFVYRDRPSVLLKARLANGTRPTRNQENFARELVGVYTSLTRNVINTAITGGSDIFKVEDGKLLAKMPSVTATEWMDTGYTSYEEFVAKDGVLVTDLGAVKDSKGNIISNFNYVNDVFNKRISLSNPVRKTSTTSSTVNSPVEEQQVNQPLSQPEPLAQPETPAIGTLMDIARANTDNQSLLDTVYMLEQAGLTVNQEIEQVEEDSSRYASILPGSNVLTLTENFDALTNTRRVLTLIHEGVHYLFNDERANIESQFGDLFDEVSNIIKSSTELLSEYGAFLQEGKPRQVQIEEFVVEALTNRTFARLLSAIKYDKDGGAPDSGNNIFTKILDALLELIQKVNPEIQGTVLGEIRNRLSTIGNVESSSIETFEETPITGVADDTFDAFSDDFGGFADDAFDSSIMDNYREVDNFDSLVQGLTAKEKATVTDLFNRGELSFVCS